MSSKVYLKQDVPTPAVSVIDGCFPLAAQPTLRRPQGPLPLQKSPTANLEWASAFLDHADHLIKAREQKHDDLAKEYNLALNTIGRNETDIKKLKKDNAALNHKIEHLHADVAGQASAYRRLDEAFDHFRSQAKVAKENLAKKLNVEGKKLNAALSTVNSLEARLKKADKAAHAAWEREKVSNAEDQKDHKVIEGLQRDLEEKTKENALLQEKLDEKIKQLLEAEKEIQTAKDKQTKSENDIARLNGQIEQLTRDIADRDRTIGRYESDLARLREENDALTVGNSQLSVGLANKTTELHKSEQDAAAARKEADKLNVTLARRTATIHDLSDQLQDLTDQSEKTIREHVDTIDKLIKHDKQDEQKLAEFAKEMELRSDELKKALAHDESDESSIKQLKTSLNDLEEVEKFLRAEIGDRASHDGRDHIEKEKLKKALASLEATLKDTAEKKEASDRASNELKKQVEGLQQKVEQVTSNDVKDKDTINILTEAKERGEKAIEELKAQNAAAQKEIEDAKKRTSDAEAERKRVEAAAAKEAAELNEVNKPVLLNDVKLASPIALAGSLKGAPRDIDDETFPINCTFPVTLFNARSSKIHISTNGLFTLDSPSKERHYKKLPYRAIFWPLPDHVLAPFWADLYIYKGTPQGVYYQETGSAPNRKLEVEWYVSRYGSKKEYYHFSLAVEEAKPNLATFKYFEASDKGGKCTIGVQGPKTHTLFSYDEQKVLPGTQVTFDTVKNTYITSTFKLPAAVQKPAVNGSVVKDVKPVNGVSVNVREVVDI